MEITPRQALVDARVAKGYRSPAALGRAIGVNRATVWRWESGETAPNYKVAKKVAQLLERPVSELFG